MNLKRIFLYAGLAAFLSSCGSQESPATESQPLNFVVFYTDELQFSDLGCYGGPYPTPNIDRLAEEGIRFTRAYTTASMCTPSRYSVLTGQFPGRCSAPSFLEENPVTEPYNIAWNTWITPEKLTLPRMLSANGYVTGISGKWHAGEVPAGTSLPEFQAEDSPEDPEVDRKLREQQKTYQELVCELGGFDEAHSVVWGNYDGHPVHALRFHNFPWMTQGAVRFLERRQNGGAPFFLYLTPTAIHGPNHREDLEQDVTITPGGRDESVLRYQLDRSGLLEELQQRSDLEPHRYAGIAQTDHMVGVIRSKLRELGVEDNTAIVFIADHNIEPGKATSYEKGVHVPMIVYWPGGATGAASSQLVQNTDLYPTFLEAAGILPPESYPIDGVSLLPVMRDPDQPVREYLFTENGYTRSVTDGRYKYVALRYPESLIRQMENGEMDHVPSYVENWPQAHSAIAMQFFPSYFDPDQLFDLEADPFEQQNIWSEMAGEDRTEALKTALTDHLRTFKHPYSLDPVQFLQTEAYRSLTAANLAFDIYSIPWLSRDHGEMVWPPE